MLKESNEFDAADMFSKQTTFLSLNSYSKEQTNT